MWKLQDVGGEGEFLKSKILTHEFGFLKQSNAY